MIRYDNGNLVTNLGLVFIVLVGIIILGGMVVAIKMLFKRVQW